MLLILVRKDYFMFYLCYSFRQLLDSNLFSCNGYIFIIRVSYRNGISNSGNQIWDICALITFSCLPEMQKYLEPVLISKIEELEDFHPWYDVDFRPLLDLFLDLESINVAKNQEEKVISDAKVLFTFFYLSWYSLRPTDIVNIPCGIFAYRVHPL